MFFDFLPLSLGEIRGFKTRFHLYTVPGQVFYDASRKLILKGVDGVVFVAGHLCSHSSIAAAKVYEEAKTLMINPGSSAAKLTDEGRPNVFRVNGRDDQQGAMLGDYLAEHWADKEIAILDDGTAWGAGVANAVRRRLRERGVSVTVDETFTPGEAEYSALVSKMQATGVDVFLPGTLQRDCLLPISRGGRYTLDNVVPACASCNASKCHTEVTVWLRRKRLDERAFLVRHAELRSVVAERLVEQGPRTP